MPQPFAGQKKTPNKNFDATNDNVCPSLRSMNMKDMKSTTALQGQEGSDCKLVHGNRWQHIDRSETTYITPSKNTDIGKDEVCVVHEKLFNRVIGVTNDTRVGVHNQTNIAPRNDEFLHTRSEIHHQPEHREQKTEDHEKTERLNKFIEKHFEANWFKLSVFYGPEINLNGILAFEAKALAVGCKTIACDNVMLDCELNEIGTAINIVATDLVAVKLKAAAAHLKAVAANLNAGIAANGDSPLG